MAGTFNFVRPLKKRNVKGQGMIETGLVVGLVSVLVVASLYVLTGWAGQTFNQQATTGDETAEFTQEMAEVTGSGSLNSTSYGTTTSVTSTTSTSSSSTSTTATTTTSTTSTSTTVTTTTTTSTTTTSTTSTILDSDAPVVQISSPTNNQAVNGAFNLDAVITDNVSVSSATYMSVGANPTDPTSGNMTAIGGGSYRASLIVPNGNYTHSVTITATDGVGNVGTATINFK